MVSFGWKCRWVWRWDVKRFQLQSSHCLERLSRNARGLAETKDRKAFLHSIVLDPSYLSEYIFFTNRSIAGKQKKIQPVELSRSLGDSGWRQVLKSLAPVACSVFTGLAFGTGLEGPHLSGSHAMVSGEITALVRASLELRAEWLPVFTAGRSVRETGAVHKATAQRPRDIQGSRAVAPQHRTWRRIRTMNC